MAYMGSGESGRKARIRETNNYQGGRSGSKVPLLPGPAAKKAGGRDMGANATRGGGINRATRGTGAGKRDY